MTTIMMDGDDCVAQDALLSRMGDDEENLLEEADVIPEFYVFSNMEDFADAAAMFSEYETYLARRLAQERHDAERQEYLTKHLNERLASLDERTQYILRLRFGLIDRRTYTVQEIADLLCISKQRVSQLINRAIERYRGTEAA